MRILRLSSLIFFLFLTACGQSSPIPRATLYPAFTLTQGAAPREIDPELNYNSFVEGYVLDNQTKTPIAGATVSIPGLETTTTTDGYYLLQGVPTGRQALEIRKDGYEPLYRIAQVPVSSSGQTLTMKLSELEPKSQRVTMIGASGGTHFASSLGEAGPFIRIPAGALETDTPIQFTHLRTANTLPELPQDGYSLAFAHLAPTGLVFKKPATLFLPLQPGIVIPIGQTINISYFDSREAKWIDDITNGKISSINGKLFLEYEINHFTWIGGSWYPDYVSGCVQDQDGIGVPNVTTKWGVTDSIGRFFGTTTQSNINTNLTAYAILPNGTQSESVSVFYDGHNNVTFPSCILYETAVPVVATPEPEVRNSCDGSQPITPFGTGLTTRVNTQTQPSSQIRPQATEPPRVLLMARDAYGFTTRINDFKRGGADASQTKFFIGGSDVTQSSRVKSLGNASVEVSIKFKEPLKAQANLEIRLETNKRGGGTVENKVMADVVAGFEYGDIALFEVDDADWIAGIPSPLIIEGDHLQVFYKKSQGNLPIRTSLTVRPRDEKGDVVPINSDLNLKFKDGFDAGSAPFVDGESQVPIVFMPSDVAENQRFDVIANDSVNGASGRLLLQQIGGICPIARQPEIYRPLPQFPPLIPTILGGFGKFFKFAGAVASRAFLSLASLVFLSSDTQIITPGDAVEPAELEKWGKVTQKDNGEELINVTVGTDLNGDGTVDNDDTDLAGRRLIDNLIAIGGRVVPSSNPKVEIEIELPNGTRVQLRKADVGTASGVTTVDVVYPTPRASTRTKTGQPYSVKRVKLKFKK
jgi:hypothetical protein